MRIKLVNPDYHMRAEYTEMMDEWIKDGSKIAPASLITEYHTDEEWETVIRRTNDAAFGLGGNYPAFRTFYARDISSGKLLGAILIKRYVKKGSHDISGHIGYGIRPSERRKGYATEMLKMGLEECKQWKTEKVMISCRDDNIGSAKVIENCGGVFENCISHEENGENILFRRYWINL